MAVTKMHGARNDFVVLDLRSNVVANLETDISAFAREVCERHAGIGADGLLTLAASSVADARMRILNADGSEALMCGNGIRCIARYLDEAGEGDTRRIQTESGVITTRVVSREPEYLVRVEIGTPHLHALSDAGNQDMLVEIGNPHVVLFRDAIDNIDLRKIAEKFQTDARFVGGINVHLVSVRGPRELQVRHYEHGAGMTMACGTGAVASAAAALARGSVTSPVDVSVPGGRLLVEWDGIGSAYLTGPAVRVFDTTFALPT